MWSVTTCRRYGGSKQKLDSMTNAAVRTPKSRSLFHESGVFVILSNVDNDRGKERRERRWGEEWRRGARRKIAHTNDIMPRSESRV